MTEQPAYPGYGGSPESAPAEKASGKAIASLVLGVISMLAWCLPIVGGPVAIVGLVLGIIARRGPGRGLAVAGIVLSAIGLLASIINAGVGIWMYTQGTHPMVQ